MIIIDTVKGAAYMLILIMLLLNCSNSDLKAKHKGHRAGHNPSGFRLQRGIVPKKKRGDKTSFPFTKQTNSSNINNINKEQHSTDNK